MEMASTCSIDRILLDLELLRNSFRGQYAPYYVRDAIKHMKVLKIFLMCARKWSRSNDLYLEFDNVVKRVSLPSFLSCIEDTFHEYEEDIHSLSLRSETDKNDYYFVNHRVFPEIERQIKLLKQEIIQIYFALASSRSLQSNSCMTDDELLEFIDLILQNLADLSHYSDGYMHRHIGASFISAAVSAPVQALEAKLTFLKSFIPFAKMRGTADFPALLLAHFEVVALKAARLSYMCSYWDDAEEMHNPEFYNNRRSELSKFMMYKQQLRKCTIMMCEQQQKIRAVDFHVYEIYKEVLRASNSSASLHTPMMQDKQILNNFNDSLISCLWELLCYSSSFMDSMKDEMHILYAGLRFLRSILREQQEKMDEQNKKIGSLLSEAGIIICSPSLNRVKEGEVSFSESTEALDCYDALANTNIHIKHFKDQISGSSIIESLPSSSRSIRAPEVSQTSSHMLSKGKMPIAHEVMVGLDDEAAKVIERLIWGPEQVEIVPIVGMAGLGKTTLAKKVYNDSSVICNFHIRLWCTVSPEFNTKSLLIQILCSNGKQSRMDEELKNLNEHELLHKLYQRLKTKRYLVVFDDVWDIEVWNELRISFPDEKKGSRIIFTSRSSNVASQVEFGGKPHNLVPLSEKESFELLLKKVFGNEDCPQALHGLGMEIAKKCRGLPLAVVVVAGVLATTEHDICVWEEFAESLTSTMVSDIDQCKKSLELSYEHLPYHLKACLLYFAAFREDEKISAKNLMRLWIAEGFVEKIEGKRSEVIAEEYLMDLIGRNLVMVSESRSIGGAKTCYIHDLIFEFCKGKAKEKKFLQVMRGYDELSTFNEPLNVLRLSICSSGEDFIKSKLFCPHLGTLLFFGATPVYEKFVSTNISFLFCIYKHLEVLNLENINLMLNELPTEVESLLCLRYLALTSLTMTFIPPSIAKLSHLETFCLNSNGPPVSLPDSIWNMKKLMHVHVRPAFDIRLSSNDNVVENLSILPNLDTLSTLFLYRDIENILRRILNVRRLKILYVWKQNRVCNMSRLVCLESLTLDGHDSFDLRENVQLSFPMNLKKLCLFNLGLPRRKMSLIEQLPNLEVLKLQQWSMEGQKWELMEGGFPKLRVLTLECVKVVEWIEADLDSGDDYFPCLQQLNLKRISNLKMMPACLERILTLETIKVLHCVDGVKSLAREIEEAQKNYGNENLKIIIID